MKKVVLLLVVAFSQGWAEANPPKAPPGYRLENDPCLECHSDKSLSKTTQAGKEISLFIDVAIQKASAHHSVACASCHNDVGKNHPHNNVRPKPVDCRACHKWQSATYDASVHGLALKSGDEGAPRRWMTRFIKPFFGKLKSGGAYGARTRMAPSGNAANAEVAAKKL